MEIRARSLSLSFPGAGGLGFTRRRVPAVRGVDLRVGDGEVAALAGRNGSGKTTTLRLLAGLLAPDAGEALLDGEPAVRDATRRGLGYLGEEDGFPPGLSVAAFLRYAARLIGFGGAEAEQEIRRIAHDLDLEAWLDRRAGRCSLGVRRRIGLAQALLGRPRALILDEPLTGIDPVARAGVIRAIRAAAEDGAAVIVSLHDGAAIEALTDRLIVLSEGAVARDGPVSSFSPGAAGAARAAPGDWLAAVLGDAEQSPR